jgi:signal transduction histidine kinase
MKPSLVGRLMLAYAAVVASVLLSTWWSLRSLAEAERAAARLSDRSVEALDLSAKLESLLGEKSHLADYLISDNPDVLAEIRPHRQQFQSWIAQMEDFARTEPERAHLARMRDEYASYTTDFDAVVRLQQEGNREEARRRFVAMADDIEHVLADGQQLFSLAEQDMQDRRQAAEAAAAHGRTIVLWLTGLGALVTLALGFSLSRYAAQPIYRLVLRLGNAGVGDQVQVDGDELGTLEAHVSALLDRVRQQERALQQAQKLSELGEIASEIAHEALNPVTGVKGMLQALRRTSLPPERLKAELSDMERQLGRVADTVRRLMSYARPLEPRMRRVAVPELLGRAVRSARLAPGVRDRTIRVEPVSSRLEWEMDPDLIEQVLTNLVVNACEASPSGAEVVLEAHAENGHLLLSVRDHGTGVAPAIRARLFHPFVTTKPHGNGLGLAVSRNIVQEHGGQIEVIPEERGGSIFRVLLPRADALCASRS